MHVVLLSCFNENLFIQIFEIYLDIKFHENPSSCSRVVTCGQTDMTKVTVAFSNFANAPKNWRHRENDRNAIKQLGET